VINRNLAIIECFSDSHTIVKNMMNTTKGLGKSNQSSASAAQKSEDESSGNKPITTTLLQELQNLKDKFKSEDDNVEKGMLIDYTPSHYN
jgi:hypothetical protein